MQNQDPITQFVALQFDLSVETKRKARDLMSAKVAQAAQICCDSIRKNGTIYWIGNGGSAADAAHMAAELVGRYKRERKPIRSQSLTTNTSNLTAIGNDYGYEFTFERQLQAFATADDVLIAISTSGNSANVVRAAELARKIGTRVIALTGETGGRLLKLADVLLNVPSADTARIQETHLLIEHTICDIIEQSILD